MKLRNIDRKARVQNVMLFYTGIVFYILMALENHYKYFNFNWLEIAFVIHSFIFTFVNIYSFYYELPTERKDSIYKIREYVDENLELITFYDQKVFYNHHILHSKEQYDHLLQPKRMMVYQSLKHRS